MDSASPLSGAPQPPQPPFSPGGPLRRHLAWFLGLLLAALVAGGGWLGLAQLGAQHARDLEVRLHAALELADRSLRTHLDSRQGRLRALADRSRTRRLAEQLLEARQAPGGPAAHPARVQVRQLAAPLLAEPGTVGLALVDDQQINLFSVGLGPVGAVNALAERGDHLLAALRGQAAGIPLLTLPAYDGSEDYRPRLLVAAPVGDGQDKALAVMLLALDPALLLALVWDQERPAGMAQVHLYDRDGRVVAQGRGPGPSAASHQPQPPAGQAPWSSRAGWPAGRSGLDLAGYPDQRGELMVGAWRWNQALGLGLAVEMPAGQAQASLDLAQRLAWWGLALFLALLAGFGLALARQTRRTQALTRELALANQEFVREVGQCQAAEALLQAGRERYHRLFHNVRDLIFVFRLEPGGQPGPISEVNQAAREMLDLAPAELVGRDPRSILQPLEDHQATLALLDGQGQALFETLLLRADGDLVPAEISAQVFELEGQRMVLCLARDLSERRRAQQEIREREARLEAMVEGFEGFIYICSSDFHLEFANRNLMRHLGRDPLGEPCHQAVHGSPEPCAWCRDGSIRQGRTWRREYQNPLDGRWYYAVTSPLTHPDGRVSQYGMLTDITERKQTQERLAASEANYRAIFNAMEDAVFVHDPKDGAFLDVNPAACALYGYTGQQFSRMTVSELSDGQPPFDQEAALARIGQALAGRHQRFEWMARHASGRRFWVEVGLKRIVLGGQTRLLAMVRDISQRKNDEEQLQLAARVFENTVEGITVTDRQGNIQMVNPGFSLITGYAPQEVMGQNPRILRSDRHDPDFYQRMWAELTQRGQWSGEIWNRRKNGEAYPEWLNISAIRDGQGQVTHYVAVFHDITEIKASQEQIKYQAYHDALTGLPNRALFNDRLRMALARARRGSGGLAVLFLDLDHFKSINDSLGHAVGDLLLQEVAARLGQCLRQEDTAARLGGDEFIMLVPEVNDAGQAVAVAQRIIEALERPFLLRGHDLYVTASIGITLFPADGQEPETLVKNADMAMYRAKEQGRNTYQLYTPSMNKRVMLRQSLLGNLRKALEQGELTVHYQPKVDLASGRVAGMEALVRWPRADGQMMTPGKFIPLAEETGLILPLGQQVLEKACRQTALWASQGHPGLTLAVNLSARQFSQPQLLESVQAILDQSGLAPGLLELEITESVVMSNVQAASQVLKLLHAMGVSLALDDFGTGYSSLYYLKHLAIDVLKIDRSFVRDIPHKPEAKAIAEAVVSMARSLRLKVVAEGVETREQLGFLREVGCDYMQGYLFSRPLSAEDFTALLREGRRLEP